MSLLSLKNAPWLLLVVAAIPFIYQLSTSGERGEGAGDGLPASGAGSRTSVLDMGAELGGKEATPQPSTSAQVAASVRRVCPNPPVADSIAKKMQCTVEAVFRCLRSCEKVARTRLPLSHAGIPNASSLFSLTSTAQERLCCFNFEFASCDSARP